MSDFLAIVWWILMTGLALIFSGALITVTLIFLEMITERKDKE
jgi:hypothetical protein